MAVYAVISGGRVVGISHLSLPLDPVPENFVDISAHPSPDSLAGHIYTGDVFVPDTGEQVSDRVVLREVWGLLTESEQDDLAASTAPIARRLRLAMQIGTALRREEVNNSLTNWLGATRANEILADV